MMQKKNTAIIQSAMIIADSCFIAQNSNIFRISNIII